MRPFWSNIPDTFNEYFLKAEGQVSEHIGNRFRDYLLNSPNFSMYLHPVTFLQIVNYIKSLKTSSYGHDEIYLAVL